MTVKLTGTIHIPIDQQDVLLPLLEDHIAASRAETGNLRFDITQDKNSPEVFHLDEEFVDEDAFSHHQTRGSASPWGVKSKDLTRNFTKTEY